MLYLRLVILQLVLINLSLQIPNEWKAWNNFELLNEYMGGLKFDPFVLESDKNLNNIAQFLAETNDNNLIHSYENISNDEVVLTFGIKLNGSKTYKELLNTSLDSAVSFGFILYKLKNNLIKLKANHLKELMNLARCESCELFKNLWKQSNGSFEFLNKDVNANLKIENMLEFFQSIVIEQKEINKSYLEISNFINKLKILLSKDEELSFKSNIKNKYLTIDFEINSEPNFESNQVITSLTELFQIRFKTLYEMLDRDSVFESFSKYGQGYALDSNENINIVFSLSGTISSLIQKDTNNYFSKLSSYLFSWPWFFSPPSFINSDSKNKASIIQNWKNVLGLSMIQVNRYRSVNSLSLIEKAISLERLARNLSNKMLINENFVIPDLSSQTTKTLIIAIILSGETSISQYDFSNDHNFEKIKFFDNFSKKKHSFMKNNKLVHLKNIFKLVEKYNKYGSAYSTSKNGDIFMTIALSIENIF